MQTRHVNMDLPYDVNALRAVCQDPGAIALYLKSPAAPRLGALAFNIEFLAVSNMHHGTLTEEIYRAYTEYARQRGIPALNQAHYGRELCRWFKLIKGRLPTKSRYNINGIRTLHYRQVELSKVSLVGSSTCTVKAIEATEIHTVNCPCPICSVDRMFKKLRTNKPEDPASTELEEFINTKLVVDAAARALTNEVYNSYSEFCSTRGVSPMNQIAFGKKLSPILRKHCKSAFGVSRFCYDHKRKRTYRGISTRRPQSHSLPA